MKTDLAGAFFERDLSDAEWRELGRQLADEEAVADRFLDGAAAYYASLGLPEPRLPKHGGGFGGWAGGLKGLWLGLGLGLITGGGAAWLLMRPDAPLPPAPALPLPPTAPEPAAAAPAPIAPTAPIQARPKALVRASSATEAEPLSRATLSEPPARSVAARPMSQGFPGLEAVIELASQGLVTAKVLDPQGREVRQLFAGVLEAGRFSFGWDGRDEAGRGVAPGTYTIEVREGSRALRRSVELKAKAPLVGP